MRKIFTRLFSVVLALVMVFSMAASAQVERTQIKINTPQGMFDAALITGYDADGCEQIILESTQLGRMLLQADGEALTFGSDASGYLTIDAEELREAITTIVYMITEELPLEDIFNVINYISGPMFEEDSMVVAAFISNELNRFAAVAAQMGLIVVSENGDLTVEATYEEMIKLFAGYLAALSADADSISLALSLNLFNVMGVDTTPAAAQIPVMLQSIAQNLEASAAYAQEGGLKIFISAEGAMEAVVTVVQGSVVFAYELKADANGSSVKASVTEGAYYAEAVFYADANGVGCTADLKVDEYVVDIDFTLGSEGYNLNGIINVPVLHGTMNGMSNAEKSEFNMDITDGDTSCVIKAYSDLKGESFSMNAASDGRIAVYEYDFDYENDEYTLKINNNFGYQPVKLVAEYFDGELYVDYSGNGKTILLTGSKAYRLNANWSNYYNNYSLNGTLRFNEGISFVGELTESGYANNVLNFDFAVNNGTFTAKLYDNPKNAEFSIEYTLTENGIVGTEEAIMYFSSTETMKSVRSFSYDFVNNEYIINVEATMIDSANGLEMTLPASLIIKDGLFEFKCSIDGMEYRVFLEDAIENGILTAKGGFTGGMMQDPSVVQELVAFALAMNLDTLVHDATLTAPIADLLVSSSFDGSVYTFVYNVDGARVEATARMVEEENDLYLLIEINANGMPVVAKIGMKMLSENEVKFYAEATANGETIGAAINLSAVETATSTGITAALEVTAYGQTQQLGSVSLTHEVADIALEHVEGTPITAEQLVEVFMMLISQMM